MSVAKNSALRVIFYLKLSNFAHICYTFCLTLIKFGIEDVRVAYRVPVRFTKTDTVKVTPYFTMHFPHLLPSLGKIRYYKSEFNAAEHLCVL